MSIQEIVILASSDLSYDVAQQVEAKLSPLLGSVKLLSMGKAKDFKSLLDAPPTTLAIFVAQTVENESPPEDAGACVRFFKRKDHPVDLLNGKIQFAVLGLGDSNLLLDRQHTAAKDCNQVAQQLDLKLEALGATRYYSRGEADERTELTEVEPWIDGLVEMLGGSS
jgi:sulfite reductase alpha subunit-like flavoprotein